MSTHKKQIGARVDETLHDYFKQYVNFEHDAERGPLGESHEEAMKFYLAHRLTEEDDTLDEFIDAGRIDEDPDVIRDRMIQYLDDVGPQVAETACRYEEIAGSSDSSTSLRQQFDQPIQIWHRVRERLFNARPVEVEKEDLKKFIEYASRYGGIDEAVERFEQLSQISEDEDPLAPPN
jgi:hypothetical protein